MILPTPILKQIKPFDNTLTTGVIEFSYDGGNQCMKNQLVITKNSDNTEVYNSTIESFQLKHTIPINTLQLNTEYKAKVKVYDINNNSSEFSEESIFICLSATVVTISNIINGQINNQTFEFQGTYSQTYDALQSYRFILYDNNNAIISSSSEKFDKLLKHEFTGFNNDDDYKIELRTMSVNGVESTSGLVSFTCRFIQPKIKFILELENRPTDGSVNIKAKIIQILGEVINGTVTYSTDNEWINLKQGAIGYNNNLEVHGNFTMQILMRNCADKQSFMVLYDNLPSQITLMYRNDKIYMYHDSNKLHSVICSGTLGLTDIVNDKVYIYLQHNNGNYLLKAKKYI